MFVQIEPITSEMCSDKIFKHLHMCIALKNNIKSLKKTVEDYSCLFSHIDNSAWLFPAGLEALGPSSVEMSPHPTNASVEGAATQSHQFNHTKGWSMLN